MTHEAAIETVNRKELESLLARGLTEDEVVDLIIRLRRFCYYDRR